MRSGASVPVSEPAGLGETSVPAVMYRAHATPWEDMGHQPWLERIPKACSGADPTWHGSREPLPGCGPRSCCSRMHARSPLPPRSTRLLGNWDVNTLEAVLANAGKVGRLHCLF